MTFFKGTSKNSSDKSANTFATPSFCAKNSTKFNMAAFCSDTAVAVSVLLFVIICIARIIYDFLIICGVAIIINIIIKNKIGQNAAVSYGM